jgi:hypothetical protein
VADGVPAAREKNRKTPVHRCATITAVGRRTVITPKVERQLDALLDVVPQERAALAVGISRRSVQRYAARRRKEAEPQTLDELLASLPSFEEITADDGRARPPARRRRRARARGWEEAARMLETQAPQRWGPPVDE